MKVYFISPQGHKTPQLYDSFVHTFRSNGYDIVDNIENAECVFFDLHSRFAQYDEEDLKHTLAHKLPLVIFDAWDYIGTGKSPTDWFGWDWSKLRSTVQWESFLHGAMHVCNPFIYFMRKMSNYENYPQYVYPLELIEYENHRFPTTTKEELCSRPYDVCFVGNASPFRSNLICSLIESTYIKVRYIFPYERLSHDKWINEHSQAKFFIEANGGGFGSERPYQLMRIAPMLRGRTKQRIENNWVFGVDCVDIGDEMNIVDKEEIPYLYWVLHNPDKLYEIYLNGINRLETYFNATHRASYVIDILKQNGLQ